MRFLTAIPLLFWASTAAVAHLAVQLWTSEPAAAITHATASDSAVQLEAHSPAAELVPGLSHPVAIEIAPKYPPAQHAAALAQPSDPGVNIARRIFEASALLANPPPVGA